MRDYRRSRNWPTTRAVADPSRKLADQLAVVQKALLALEVLVAQTSEIIEFTRAVTDEAKTVLEALTRAEGKKESGKRRSMRRV